MSEKHIELDDFYLFAKGKDSDLCRVKHCRNEKAPRHSLCHKHRMRIWRARNPMRAAYNRLKNKAKARKIGFSLSFPQFATLCEVTGYIEGTGQDPSCLTIDRIDPNLGYEQGNIQVITLSENSSKGSYERWVETNDGQRVRVYQIIVGREAEEEEAELREGGEWEPPDWLTGKNQPFVTIDEPF